MSSFWKHHGVDHFSLLFPAACPNASTAELQQFLLYLKRIITLTLEGPCIIFCNIYTFFLKRCTSGTYQIVRFLRHTIVCTYSI